MGHNSIPSKLDMAAHDARLALGNVEKAEADTVDGWIAYGTALLVGKKLTEDPECGVDGQAHNNRFGNWISGSKLEQLVNGKVHKADQAAALWAAEYPDQLEVARSEWAKVRTLRGWHAKWMKANPPAPVVVEDDPVTDVVEDIVEDDPVTDVVNVHTSFDKLRPRQQEIYQMIEAAGPEGIKRDDMIDTGLNWATNKHIDTNMVPLFIKGMVTAVADGHFVAVRDRLGPPVNVDALPDTYKAKVEAAKRRIERDFDWKVRDAVREEMKGWKAKHLTRVEDETKELLARIDRLGKTKSAKLTPAEYKDIVRVLHPSGGEDARTMERKTRAEAAFNKLGIEPMTSEEIDKAERNVKLMSEMRKKMGL